MEKKQNSIDYLIEQLEGENNRIAMVVGVKKYNSIVKQAKAMHKEEVQESYREGRSDQQSKETFYHRNAEQYYNEHYEHYEQ